MITLFSFCDTWWIAWILPFLLALGIGWLLWGKYKAMVDNLEAELKNLNVRIQELEAANAACKSAKIDADGQIAILRGRLRELEAVGLIQAGSKKIVSSTTHIDKVDEATPITSETYAPIVTANTAETDEDKWFAAIGTDKLQIVEGIGKKMEEVLHENGIYTFQQLGETTPQRLRSILDKYGDRYRIIDPNTWPQQASLADARKWEELIILQKSLDTGRSDTIAKGSTDSKLENWLIKMGVIRRWAQDDLKAIEGIGPKIEGLLHADGIKTWRTLAETPVSHIQQILDAAGSRFALASPTTWPQQAQLAAESRWDDLKTLQDSLNAGKLK